MLRVIIGSYALNYHLNNIDYADIDIIVPICVAKELSYNCSKKKGNILCFDKLDKKVDIMIANNGDQLVLEFCNNDENKVIISLLDHDFIIAPLKILYIIKKSHTHRIIPHCNDNSYNIKIWRRQMTIYNE